MLEVTDELKEKFYELEGKLLSKKEGEEIEIYSSNYDIIQKFLEIYRFGDYLFKQNWSEVYKMITEMINSIPEEKKKLIEEKKKWENVQKNIEELIEQSDEEIIDPPFPDLYSDDPLGIVSSSKLQDKDESLGSVLDSANDHQESTDESLRSNSDSANDHQESTDESLRSNSDTANDHQESTDESLRSDSDSANDHQESTDESLRSDSDSAKEGLFSKLLHKFFHTKKNLGLPPGENNQQQGRTVQAGGYNQQQTRRTAQTGGYNQQQTIRAPQEGWYNQQQTRRTPQTGEYNQQRQRRELSTRQLNSQFDSEYKKVMSSIESSIESAEADANQHRQNINNMRVRVRVADQRTGKRVPIQVRRTQSSQPYKEDR